MARLTVFRGFLNELTTAKKPCTLNHFGSGRLFRNVTCSARFSSSTAGNERTEQERSREERIRREKRLVGLVIGSSVGLIGSLYFLFRRLYTHAKAESKTPSIDLMSENSMDKNQEEGNEETDAKRKNHKQGFRERRVRNFKKTGIFGLFNDT